MDRLDELAVFIAILEAGSLADAGRRLRRSPPTVTRCLAALEDRLGLRLFERTTRQLAPTEAGRQLAGQARRLLADYGDALQKVGADEVVRGGIRITAPEVFGRRHVMPIVVDFMRAYPLVRLDMQFSDRNLDLVEDELDVAVRIGWLAGSSLVAQRVGEVKRVLVASPSYLAVKGMPVKVDDLFNHDVIFNSVRPMAAEWRLHENGRERIVRFQPRLVVSQVEAALYAVREGLGIGRALSYQVADDLKSGNLVRLLTETEPAAIPIHLVVSETRYMPARTRLFLDFAADRLKAIPVVHGYL